MTREPFIDLHMHSTASDGMLEPEALMEKAHANGVGVISLTDHDTMKGVRRAAAKAKALGMHLIPGVEISTTTHGKSCHLLAYFESIEITEKFASFLEARLEARERRFQEMVEKFHAQGIPLDAALVRKLANGAAITRPHVARALLEQGIVSDYQEAFDRFIATGKPCHVPYEKLPTADTIAEVHSYGGITSVAHPGIEKFTKTELADLRSAGLDAVEVYHYDHDLETRQRYHQIAGELGLLETGGSDFHGYHERTFYETNTEAGGVPPKVRAPLLEALSRAATQANGQGR